MNGKELITAIDKKISERSILKHSFYQSWRGGKLTRQMLQLYAKQYYKHVAAFPQYLSAIHSKIDDVSDRKLVLQNLMDEEYGEDNHPELWLRFGEALGITREEIKKEPASEETISFVNCFMSVTSQKSPAEGIAALYAYESQIPDVSEEKIKGLVDFYGVSTQEGLEYFKVHIKADIEHSKAERELIAKYASDEETQKNVLDAVDHTLDAYWKMLSGIQKECKGNC